MLFEERNKYAEDKKKQAQQQEQAVKNRKAWLKAGMPLTEPLVIKNKPLTFNKKPR